MSAIFFLIAISILVALGFLLSFFWAVSTHQYDDDETPAIRMLFDNELIKTSTNKNQSKK
ncbi:MAG: cbb3-type cytochrome oxidase assembly protein CcoS [Luteibaculaceae bacterium]